MRARGANVTDIVILVVSADDGVMPQTREALSHAQAAKVPIIVAVNKIDKPGANPEKIKQGSAELELARRRLGRRHDVRPRFGSQEDQPRQAAGCDPAPGRSAGPQGQSRARASGTVLEARLEKGRGPVVSVLVSRGTLRVGDAIVSGPFAGKVKAMTDDKGQPVKEAGPGIAVEVLGFEGVPNAGENFNSPATEADARKVAENRIDKASAKSSGAPRRSASKSFSPRFRAGDVKELNVIVKADVLDRSKRFEKAC